MSFRKGSPRHALAGKIFVIAMLTMSSSAVYLAFMKHQMGNVLGGTFAFYLATTAWLTARRADGGTSIFDWGMLLIPLFVGIGLWISGLQAVHRQARSTDGVPLGMHFFMGSVMLLAAAGDIRMLRRLWRQAHRAPSLAHVLCSFHRHGILFPRTAAGLPRLVAQNKRVICAGSAAARLADFLAVSRLVHQYLPKKGSPPSDCGRGLKPVLLLIDRRTR